MVLEEQSCLQRERVDSGNSEDLEKSNLAKGSTGQSKGMGPTCTHVVALIGSIFGQVMSVSFADWVSCTNMHWLLRSHREEQRRQENASHESSLEQDAESCTITPRVKDNTKCRTGNRGKGRLDTPNG